MFLQPVSADPRPYSFGLLSVFTQPVPQATDCNLAVSRFSSYLLCFGNFCSPCICLFLWRLLATGRSIILISLKISRVVVSAVVPVIVPPAQNDKMNAVKNVYPAVFLYPFCPNDIFHNLLFYILFPLCTCLRVYAFRNEIHTFVVAD